jgi:hypothetical protein
MGASKRINTGDYAITTFPNSGNPTGNVTVKTNSLVIDGNLVVYGTYANIQAFDTINPILVLNANLTTANAPRPGLSGIMDNRGNLANVGLYWDESGGFAGQWIANSGPNAGPILTSYNTKLEQVGTAPSAQTGYTVIKGALPGIGETGVFVNPGTGSAELISTVSAKKYGIIFG